MKLGERATRRTVLVWCGLGVAAVLAGLVGQGVGLPAAWLVGPMLVAISFALVSREGAAAPPFARTAAQAVIGTMLASAFRPGVLPVVAGDWLPVALVLIGTLLLSLTSGFALARLTRLDGETAALGTLPGAAAGMLAMSPSLGADTRMVALMQYARVVLVVLSATLISRFGLIPGAGAGGGGSAAGIPTSPPARYALAIYASTAAVMVAGAWIGRRLRLPAGALLGPLVLGVVASELGFLHPALPPGVPQAAYVALGIFVGLLFDSESLKQAGRVLPAVLVSILVLMAACAALGLALAALTGTDPFTAYLATTPGGIDSVSIIALGSGADVSLVLAVQMLRVLAVVLAGPPLARLSTRLIGRYRT